MIVVHQDVELTVDTRESYSFVIAQHEHVVITLYINVSIVTDLKFFCHDARDLTIRLIVLFPQSADINISVMMCGSHSKVAIVGLCAIAADQVVTIRTNQIHCGNNNQSSLVLQGLVAGHAALTYDGTIRIEKDAFGTYALQNNKNILLSSQAAAISIPNIEVLNHDVQCYHGAAIGRFDTQQMQYMQSRGLHDQLIKQFLVQAFFASVLDGYENKEFILQTVYEKI